MDPHAIDLAAISAQFADPARAAIVITLMDGSSRSAGELGLAANLSASSASGHLSKLVRSGILLDSRVGRQKRYRIRAASVAHAVETLLVIAPISAGRSAPPGAAIGKASHSPLNPFAFARTCYDHLAGRLGVELADALEREKIIRPAGKVFEVTTKGFDWFDDFKIDGRQLKSEKRGFALQCLDFTERRPHLAGALGSAICARMIELGWVVRTRVSRAVRLTAEGRKELRGKLGIVFRETEIPSAAN